MNRSPPERATCTRRRIPWLVVTTKHMFDLMIIISSMGTAKQNAANRKNSRKSTGPTSAEGKSVSSANALRHGVHATTARAIPRGYFAEDQGEIDTYVSAIISSLQPRDQLEYEQAGRIARYFLQYKRLSLLEAEALAGDTVEGNEFDELSAIRQGRNQEDLGTERAAISALSSAMERVTRLDSRIGRSLERAIVVYYSLQQRDLMADSGETNPILGPGA